MALEIAPTSQPSDPVPSEQPARNAQESLSILLQALQKHEQPTKPSAESLTAWLQLPHRETARALFRLLRRNPREHILDAVAQVFAHLYRHSPKWRLTLSRSLRRHGRCPKSLRAFVRRHLSISPSDASTAASAFRLPGVYQPTPSRVVHRTSKVAAPFPSASTVQLCTDDTSIETFPGALLRKLTAIQPGRKHVIVDCESADHLFVVGLALLATWARSTKRILQFSGGPSSVRSYVERMGVADFADGVQSEMLENEKGWSLPLQPIRQSDSVEHIVERLVSIFDRHAILAGPTELSGLRLVLSELLENVQRHAGDAATACVGAQFFPQRRKLAIVIADSGMGITRSFLIGENLEAKQRIRDGVSALSIAIEPLQTSKPERGHSGYGLYLVSELAVRNGGNLRLISGDQTLSRYALGGFARSTIRQHESWGGTVVSLIFDLNQAIPYREVYLTLPMVPGYSEEDFFD